MRRLLHLRVAVVLALTILAASIAATSARADDILLFDDSTPNGIINVTFNGIQVPLNGTVTSLLDFLLDRPQQLNRRH